MTKPAADTDILQETETALIGAVRKNLAAVRKKASVENLKNLEAAEKKLKDFQANRAAQERPGDRRFKNLREVYAYLAEEKGYKVSERKIYDDKRLITKQSDGSYLARDAEEYANQFLQKKDGSSDDNGLQQAKQEKENQLLDEKISRERRRNLIETGKLIQRSKVDQQLAARAAFLKSDLEAFAHGKLPDIAEQLLDTTAAPAEAADYIADLKKRIGAEIIAAFLHERDAWLDRYAQPLQFQSPITADLDLEDIEEEDE